MQEIEYDLDLHGEVRIGVTTIAAIDEHTVVWVARDVSDQGRY